MCLISQIVPVLPRTLSGKVYSLGRKRRELTLDYVVAIGPGNRVVSRAVARSIVYISQHVACAGIGGVLTSRSPRIVTRCRPLIPVFRGVTRLTTVLHGGHVGHNSVSFSFPRAGMVLSGGKGPMSVHPCSHGITAGLVRSFVLTTGRAITTRCC